MPSPLPPQRRPDSAEARDRRILLAARRCFAAAGFEGTTMGAVAREAGVAVGTLYLRAATKEALLARVLEDVETDLAQAMAVAAQGAAAWPDRFGEVFRALLRMVASTPELHLLMRLAHHVPPTQGIGPGPIRIWIAGFIRAGQADGALRPVDPDLAAAMAFGVVEGAMNAHAADPRRDGAAVADALTDATTRWLLASSAEPPVGQG